MATLEMTAPKQELTLSSIERWAPIGGIAFVVLMVVGSMLIGDVPAPDASASEITAYLGDSENHTRNIIGAYMWVVGGLAFLWFLVRLRSDVRRAEAGTAPLSQLAFGAGVAFVAVWMVSAAAFAAVPNAIELRDAPISDPDVVRLLPATGRLLLLQGAGFAGALLLLAVSAASFRTALFPRWLAALGVVAAIALLFDVLYLNILPFWGWVLVASIVMLLRGEATSAATSLVATTRA
jgi:hypothetical protein